MDDNLAKVEANREQERKQQMEAGDDPASQLKGLMNAQSSLHRLSALASKPKPEKIKELAAKLGVEFDPALMQLGTNEAISNALVEIAIGQGKSEAEITRAIA